MRPRLAKNICRASGKAPNDLQSIWLRTLLPGIVAHGFALHACPTGMDDRRIGVGGPMQLFRTNALLSLERSRENHTVAAMAVLRCLPPSFSGFLGCLRRVKTNRRALHDWDAWVSLGFQKAYARSWKDSGRSCWHGVATCMQAREILLRSGNELPG